MGRAIAGKRGGGAWRLLACILVAMLVTLQSPVLYSQERPGGYSTFWGMAVYKGEGVPLRVRVEVEPGSGSVHIEGVRHGALFRESVVEALYMAAFTVGVSPWSLDYRVVVEPARPEASYLRGPSLSLSVYLAALAALRGSELREGVVVTGTLNPDLTVGFVGYVREKALGAQEWNFTEFVYPILQSNRYEVKDVPRHIGPYAFMTTMVMVEPENFTGVNITLREAGWAPQEYNLLSLTGGLMLPGRYSLEALAWEAMGSLASTSRLERLLDLVEDDTLGYISRANRTLLEDTRLLANPAARGYAYQLVSEATKMLGYYEALRERGLLFAASEYLLYSYEYASRAYYYLRFLQDNSVSADEARAELAGKARLAGAILEAGAGDGVVNVYALPALAEASVSYYEASRYTRVVELDLTLLAGQFYSQSIVAYSAARILSRTLTGYTKALILASIAEQAREGVKVNVSEVAPRIVSYAKHLLDYMRELSIYTRVHSGLLMMAGSNWWIADTLIRSTNNTIARLAAIGYSLRSIAYSSLYMVLHPGFEGVEDARYPYVLRTLALLANTTGYDPMTAYVLQLGTLYDDKPDRLYYLERAIAYIKLLIALGARSPASLPHILEHVHSNTGTGNAIKASMESDEALSSLAWFREIPDIIKPIKIVASVAATSLLVIIGAMLLTRKANKALKTS